MDFDREYNKARRPAELDDFTDANVQALIEGRRTKALPRPRLDVPPRDPKGPFLYDGRHYDSQGYCDNPGRGY